MDLITLREDWASLWEHSWRRKPLRWRRHIWHQVGLECLGVGKVKAKAFCAAVEWQGLVSVTP